MYTFLLAFLISEQFPFLEQSRRTFQKLSLLATSPCVADHGLEGLWTMAVEMFCRHTNLLQLTTAKPFKPNVNG